MKGISDLSKLNILRSRELLPEAFIPYVRHIDETTIANGSGEPREFLGQRGGGFR